MNDGNLDHFGFNDDVEAKTLAFSLSLMKGKHNVIHLIKSD